MIKLRDIVNEIKIDARSYRVDPILYVGMSTVDLPTEETILGADYLTYFIDVGKYYAFPPSGGFDGLWLVEKKYIKDVRKERKIDEEEVISIVEDILQRRHIFVLTPDTTPEEVEAFAKKYQV